MTASAYGHGAEQKVAVPTASDGTTWVADADRISLDLFYGAGGIVSTVHDLARWNAALMAGAFIDRATQSLLWGPGHLNDGSRVEYAMGFVPAELNLHREVWHNGFAPNAGGYCYSALFPDDHIGVVVLTNSGNAAVETVSKTIVRDVLESYFPPRAIADDTTAVTGRIRALLAQLRSGNVDRSALSPALSDVLSPALLAATHTYFVTLGEPTSLVLQAKTPRGDALLYVFRGAFADGSVHEVRIVLDGDKIGGFQVPP
jgi:CubicO group peptidase (beta-lactamase class C family)